MYAWNDWDAEPPASFEGRALRQAFGQFPTGVCLVTTIAPDGKAEGMTINSFASVSLTPALLLWSIRHHAPSAGVFIGARAFVLSILGHRQADLAMHFARPAADKFDGWRDRFEPGLKGCPRLREAVATFECRTWSRHAEGDHTVLVGRIDTLHADAGATPLMFHGGQMGSLWELAARLPAPA